MTINFRYLARLGACLSRIFTNLIYPYERSRTFFSGEYWRLVYYINRVQTVPICVAWKFALFCTWGHDFLLHICHPAPSKPDPPKDTLFPVIQLQNQGVHASLVSLPFPSRHTVNGSIFLLLLRIGEFSILSFRVEGSMWLQFSHLGVRLELTRILLTTMIQSSWTPLFLLLEKRQGGRARCFSTPRNSSSHPPRTWPVLSSVT